MTAWILSCGGGGDSGGNDSNGSDTSSDGDSSGGGDDSSGGGSSGGGDAAAVEEMLQSINDMGIGCTIDGGSSTLATTLHSLEALGRETVNKIKEDHSSRRSDSAVARTVDLAPIEFDGDCPESPGKVVLNVSIDFPDDMETYDNSQSLPANGAIEINDYCSVADDNSTVTMAGNAAFDGQISFDDVMAFDLVDVNINPTTPIVMTSENTRATIDNCTGLAVSLNPVPDGGEAVQLSWTTLDIETQQDGGEPESVRLENFSIDMINASDGSATFSVSGTSTGADGSLDIRTLTPFVQDDDGNLTDGLLQVDGADKPAVQITPTGSGYVLDVRSDTDGDGQFDDYSAVMDCTELGNQLQVQEAE
jgi:hypothetical protein